MAIYHFSAKVISRGAGRSAVAAAAYRSASELQDERLGRSHDFTAKAGVVHSEMMLPDGAPERWHDRAVLWNEVEAGERRKDAQLARDVEIALPRELSRAEGIALARDFVRDEFVRRGMVADLNVHWGKSADGEAQPHAHVMLTMRAIEAGRGPTGYEGKAGFGPKVRDWNATALLTGWRERWAEMANARLAELGHDARIDHRRLAEQGIALEPQHKVGPVGERRAERGEDAERRDEHDAIARRNGERIAADPTVALDALTRQHSTFTRQDLARFINRHTDSAEQFASVLSRVEASPALVRLGQDGRSRDRFSTRDMLAVEQRMENAAAGLAEGRRHGVTSLDKLSAQLHAGERGQLLGPEQQQAVEHVVRDGGLALVVGYAGTGKSAMLGVAREVWEGAGYRVRGAALSGIAAEGLEAGSGIESRTLASLEWAWKGGRDQLGPKDVLVVDEAGMVGSRQMERVLSAAQQAGAKVVLVGDPEQLQAIEAGAAFRALAERHGAVEISEVRRQREDWQRAATRELATGRTGAALGRYTEAGMVHEHGTTAEARATLVREWDKERRVAPAAAQIILAYTRADVSELNQLARGKLRAGNELGPDQVVQTERGELAMAAGDRLMFLRNERALGAGPDGQGGVAVKNGTLGTVLAVEALGERLTVQLDGAAGGGAGKGRDGPVATFYLRDYAHVDHGYAATIHKAQGVTVNRTHVLASEHMDRHAAYVALTRHRDGMSLHYGRDAFADGRQLARQLGRERVKDTTLDYGATFAERRGISPLVPASEIVVRPVPGRDGPKRTTHPARARAGSGRGRAAELGAAAAASTARAREVLDPVTARGAPAQPVPLLPAHRDVSGRDSLGRGTAPTEIATMAARDPQVERARGELGTWLRQAFRDPDAAWQKLAALEKSEGGPKGAERALGHGGATLLGQLRGKSGWLASAASKAEWDVAERSAQAIPAGLVRLREAETRAGQGYVGAVDAQRARDAVEVPGLSPAVWTAVQRVEKAIEHAEGGHKDANAWQRLIARQDGKVGEAWAREVLARPEVAAELRAFQEAATRRLGEDGVRETVRSASRAPDGSKQLAGLATVGRVLAIAGSGQQAHAGMQQRAHEVERQRLGLRLGPRVGR